VLLPLPPPRLLLRKVNSAVGFYRLINSTGKIIDNDVDFIGAPLAGGWRGLYVGSMEHPLWT
jgi:hypothetical protein